MQVSGVAMKHLLTMSDMETEDIMQILRYAADFEKGEIWQPERKVFAVNLFFEPSTRTRTSFEMAERKIGLEVLPFEPGASSLLKGETLYDTVKTLESIGVDLAVIRHEQEAYYRELTGKVNMQLVNGGDGCGQHPTQSLLDIYTIYKEFGTFKDLEIAIIGDLRHSRVARSNYEALAGLGANVSLSGPPEWFLEGAEFAGRYREIDEAVATADVVMLLRIQHERHGENPADVKREYHERYGLTIQREKMMQPHAIIMHPAPVNRGVEIADELVECSRSRIFNQVQNGLFTRMAVLRKLLES